MHTVLKPFCGHPDHCLQAVKKVVKLTLKSVAGLLAVLFIALLLLLWRLSSSPIQLNQFVPRIEQVASDLPGGLSVRLKGLGLFWNRPERQIDLRALSIDLVESSGASLASVPEVNVSISVFALMRGVFALSSIELKGVDVQLVRREDGSFQIFKKTDSGPVPGSNDKPRDFTDTVQNLFKVLATDEDTNHPITFLKRLKVQGSMEIEDRKNNLRWAADAVESLFIGHRGEVDGNLGVNFSSPQAVKGIHTDIAINLKDNVVTAKLGFAGVRPAGLAPLDPRLAALADLDTSLRGTIDTTITLPDKIHSLTADIKGDPGQFLYHEFYPKPLKFNSLGLQLSADLPGKSLQVSSLDVSLGDMTSPLQLHLQGSVHKPENDVGFNLEAGVQQLKVNDFDLYWPKGVAPGARAWLVNNLKDGSVTGAKLDLAMHIPSGPEAGFELKELKGSVNYSDLTVAYFGSLPPATGVTGAGTFDRHGFNLDISKGLVNGVSIDSGKVIISGMDNKQAAISVKTHLNGQLASAFAVLEAPPLRLASDAIVGAISEKLGGQIDADFSIALPLKSGLANGDIQYQASGRISDGAFRGIYRNYDLQDANIDLALDQSKVNLSGPLYFSGIPLTIDWTTILDGTDKGRAAFTIVSPNITGSQISALGYDVYEYMQGSITLKVTAKLAPGGPVTASVESDP